MAELTISSDEIRSAIENFTASYSPESSREEVGTVTDTSDGIAHVSGLPSAMSNELLEFPGGVLGVALNLDATEIGAVILGDYEHIEEGQEVLRPRRMNLNELARRALSQFNEAQERFQQGDWVGYGTSLQQLENVLRRLADDASQQE